MLPIQQLIVHKRLSRIRLPLASARNIGVIWGTLLQKPKVVREKEFRMKANPRISLLGEYSFPPQLVTQNAPHFFIDAEHMNGSTTCRRETFHVECGRISCRNS